MAELTINNKIKTIAFYLPQFHEIEENNQAYGKGFTEWTNTKKAIPLFPNHYQPRTPYHNNYYDLLDVKVMKEQTDLAQKYGLYGFCFYHYWFTGGKLLLEKPIENYLNNTEIDFPFCLCWANENWSKRWDGGNGEVIAKQDYGDSKDWASHMDYLFKFFKDPRYITKNGKPVFIIYRPDLIPNIKKRVDFIRSYAKNNGFTDICIMAQHPTYFVEKENRDIFDNYIEFEPAYINKQNGYKPYHAIKRGLERIILDTFGEKPINYLKAKAKKSKSASLDLHDYDEDWKMIIDARIESDKQIAGAFVDWDNTPRNVNGLAYSNATPEKFGYYFSLLCDKVNTKYKEKIIFINAWNEWAEGAYLEPDERYGYAYLEALNCSLKE